jgi:hypothetical protein
MRLQFLLIFYALTLSLVPAEAAPWVQFTDPNGQFSVMFPHAPWVQTTNTKDADGTTTPITEYAAPEGDGKAAMLMMVADLPGLNVDPQRVMDLAIALFAQDPKNSVQSNETQTLDGHVGRYLVLIDKDKNRISDRIFLFGGHMYQALTVTRPDASATDLADVQRFSDSLHFQSSVASLPAPAPAEDKRVSASVATGISGSCFSQLGNTSNAQPAAADNREQALSGPQSPAMVLATQDACKLNSLVMGR